MIKSLLFAILLALLLSATAHAQAAQATLTWADNSNNETGFTIERRLFTDPVTAYKSLGNTISNTTTFTDGTVIIGSVYCYRVKGFNTSGSSGYTNEACMVANPSGLVLIYTP